MSTFGATDVRDSTSGAPEGEDRVPKPRYVDPIRNRHDDDGKGDGDEYFRGGGKGKYGGDGRFGGKGKYDDDGRGGGKGKYDDDYGRGGGKGKYDDDGRGGGKGKDKGKDRWGSAQAQKGKFP